MKDKKDNLYISLILIATILAIFLNAIYFNHMAGDYVLFLKDWYKFFEVNGLKGLGFYEFDYAPLYVTFLAIFSYIPISHLIITKLFSYLFEILLAILIYKYLSLINKKDSKYKNIFLSLLIFLAPTLIFNIGWWCQCDCIYTFFVVLALYFYNKGHINKSFISLGTAFSFKLQFIFILPVFIILFFTDKKIKWYHFLYIPLMNVLYSIPSFIFGFTLKDLINVYATQTTEYSYKLNWFINNIYYLTDFSALLGKKAGLIMVVFTGLLFLLLLLYCVFRKIKFNNQTIFDLSILSVLICVLFLPFLHERYLFMGDIISIIYVLMYRKNYFQTILINFISLLGIIYYVFSFLILPFKIGTIIFILVTINQFLIFRKHTMTKK